MIEYRLGICVVMNYVATGSFKGIPMCYDKADHGMWWFCLADDHEFEFPGAPSATIYLFAAWTRALGSEEQKSRLQFIENFLAMFDLLDILCEFEALALLPFECPTLSASGDTPREISIGAVIITSLVNSIHKLQGGRSLAMKRCRRRFRNRR